MRVVDTTELVEKSEMDSETGRLAKKKLGLILNEYNILIEIE